MKKLDFVSFENKGRELHLHIEGVIGYPEDWQDISNNSISSSPKLKNVLNEINEADTDKIVLHINSPGGSVPDGLAMITALKSKGVELHTIYEAPTASMGTVIGSVSPVENISIYDYNLLLIHEPRLPLVFSLTQKKAEKMAIDLKKWANSAAKIYTESNKKTLEHNLEMMALEDGEGVWITADEAVEYGFAGKIIKTSSEQKQAAASIITESESNINKIFNINLTSKKMGLNLKRKKPLQLHSVEGENYAYRELKEGADFDQLGGSENVSGTFTINDNVVEVDEGKIKSIEKVQAASIDLTSMQNTIDKQDETINVLIDAVTEANERVDALESILSKVRTEGSGKKPEKNEFKQGEGKKMSAREKVIAAQKASLRKHIHGKEAN